MRACKKCGVSFYSWSNLQTTCPKCSKRLNPIGKNTLRYNKWRDHIARPAVIARDGVICSDCHQANGYYLHHVLGRGSHVKQKYDINNLIYICKNCHLIRHKIKN